MCSREPVHWLLFPPGTVVHSSQERVTNPKQCSSMVAALTTTSPDTSPFDSSTEASSTSVRTSASSHCVRTQQHIPLNHRPVSFLNSSLTKTIPPTSSPAQRVIPRGAGLDVLTPPTFIFSSRPNTHRDPAQNLPSRACRGTNQA